MNDSVIITNCNCGDTICSAFGLEIEYNLNGQQAGNIIVTDSSGAQIQMSPTLVLPTNGNPSTVTVTLTYSAPTTSESINVALTDGSLNILASDSVGNITVMTNIATMPVQTTAPGPINDAAALPHVNKNLPTGQALAGTNTPAQVGGNNTKVHISVEHRAAGSKRKRAVLSDQAPQDAGGAGTWKYPAIDAKHAGRMVVFTLTDSAGNVLNIERTKLT